MKSISILAGLILAFSVGTMAQEGPKGDPETAAQRATSHWDKKLDLNEEQEDKVKAIMKTSLEKRKEIRAQAKDNPDGRMDARKQMTVVTDEQDRAMKEVLTEEQYQKYLAAKDEMNERRKARRQAKRAEGAGG